ncbi:biotin/lipoyl-containing protein, partial [Acidisphaera sp. L21]|uniref:biotin/lipoyl-containing protein n=1 Tax=Acidisphaera sp. L21 TaxID=1641851 RepID=UPI00131B4BF4
MATNILMPALSPTMTEGTLARWLKKEGDTVTAGDVIAEIETDKATMEVEAVDEGVLGKILVADGTAGVQVNAPIAILVEAGEAVPTGDAPAAPAAKAAPAPETSATTPKPPAASPAPAPSANGHDKGERVFASPLARRMAQQAGIALDGIKGSGPNGRIIKSDIEAAQASGGAPKPAATPAAAPAAA